MKKTHQNKLNDYGVLPHEKIMLLFKDRLKNVKYPLSEVTEVRHFAIAITTYLDLLHYENSRYNRPKKRKKTNRS